MSPIQKHSVIGVDATQTPVYREVVAIVGLGGGAAAVSQQIPDSTGVFSLDPSALPQALTYNGPLIAFQGAINLSANPVATT